MNYNDDTSLQKDFLLAPANIGGAQKWFVNNAIDSNGAWVYVPKKILLMITAW